MANEPLVINGIEISFDDTIISDGDVIETRYYKLIQETFIPPSATKLGISAVYEPGYIIDQEFRGRPVWIR